MNSVFADSFFYFALLSSSDRAHRAADRFMATYRGRMVTTEWVLTEVGDGLAAVDKRSKFERLLDTVNTNPSIHVEPSESALFERGVALYTARPDKAWSLTDCISFVVMEREGITDALTGDRHFEQAGFRILF